MYLFPKQCKSFLYLDVFFVFLFLLEQCSILFPYARKTHTSMNNSLAEIAEIHRYLMISTNCTLTPKEIYFKLNDINHLLFFTWDQRVSSLKTCRIMVLSVTNTLKFQYKVHVASDYITHYL